VTYAAGYAAGLAAAKKEVRCSCGDVYGWDVACVSEGV
jgi:hypothetical protein